MYKAPKGTRDLLKPSVATWQYFEKTVKDVAQKCYNYSEIRTPVFEDTEVFARGVGDDTDVVQKEMYTFEDKGGRSITLKPEGTAGVVRAYIENSLFNDAAPTKLYYFTNGYRYERPQMGRFREFRQFGCEMFGSASPAADAEVITMAVQIVKQLGLEGVAVEINSIGCSECRPIYLEKLREYYKNLPKCGTCETRLEKNPMRLLDCKVEACKAHTENAPKPNEHLCGGCSEHFESVKNLLNLCKVEYKINPLVVRGLDYYNRTVFEVISNELGSQTALGGGGRYDKLVEVMGGKSTPALGFALGVDRVVMLLEKQGAVVDEEKVDLYIASMSEKALEKSIEICNELRLESFSVEVDVVGRSLKSQMKYAGKIGAKNVLIIGDDELNTGVAKVKKMETSTEFETGLSANDVKVLIG